MAFVVLASAGNIVQAQGSNPAYKNMERVKYYAVNSGYTAKDGDTTFTINGNVVNASAYRKYTASSSDFDKCCPCILETYDINDVLLSESISCTDCYVGSYKEYYRSGKIKLSGQFRENNTGSWKNIYNRGLCNVPEGEWQYYNEAGQKAYAEFWENGTFIRQVPE